MSILNSFDYVAALSPDLRQAIDTGRADPTRWRLVDNKLIDSKTGQRWYEEDGNDLDIENEKIDNWLKSIECLQLTTLEGLKELLEEQRENWKNIGFEDIESLDIENIHDSPHDYQAIWACSQIQEFIEDNRIQLNKNPDRFDSGILVLHGMGDCQSLARLIDIIKPRIILLFETDIDAISSKASDKTATETLIRSIHVNQSSLFFITDTDAEIAAMKANGIIEIVSLRSQSYCFRFSFKESTLSNQINEEFLENTGYSRAIRYQGFFTDELHVLMNGILTFTHTNTEIIQQKKASKKKRHAVVVASGPSLRAELESLKENREKYDLFCAFSTLGTMLDEGITPDYHCHIERHHDSNYVQSTEKLKDFCRNGTLLTSSSVDPRLAQLYKNVFAILRSASTSTALLVEDPDDIIYHEGTNAGTFAVSVAALMGYEVIHILGLDLGAIDQSDQRIESALSQSYRTMNIRVGGNLRESVWTDEYLKDSALILGQFLKVFKESQELKVYNYSDGQRIANTISAKPKSFHENLRSSENKQQCFKSTNAAIPKKQNFNIYNKVIAANLANKIKLQCQIMRELANRPQSDQSLDIFLQSCTDRICSFSDKRLYSDQILVRLLGGSMTRIWIVISTISRLIPENNKEQWNIKSRDILHSCINSMENLSIEALQYSLSIKDLSQHKLKSFYEERRENP